jgi:hypothetical protein
MRDPLPLLCSGRYEGLKASVHGVALATAAVCAGYNLAAWLMRRQRHLAVNSGIYVVLAVWEWIHVQHHIECLPARTGRTSKESSAA